MEAVEFLKEECKRKTSELVSVTEDHAKAMQIINDYKAMIDDIEQRTANDKLREKIDEDAYMLEIKNIEQAW